MPDTSAIYDLKEQIEKLTFQVSRIADHLINPHRKLTLREPKLPEELTDAIFEQAPPSIKCPSCSQDISQQDWDDGSKCPLCGAELF